MYAFVPNALARLLRSVLPLLALASCAGSRAAPEPATQGTNSVGAAGTPKPPSEQPIPEDLRGAVEQSVKLGVALYIHDKAAAIGTDVLQENAKSLGELSLGGYLTMQEADEQGTPRDSMLVLFYTRDAEPRVACRVHVPLGNNAVPSLEEVKPAAPMSEGMRLLVRARAAAIRAMGKPAQPINPVVLPAELAGEKGILVYLIAGTARPEVAVLGKHYRVLVAVNGSTVERIEPLTKSALELPLQEGSAPSASRVAALAVTHLLTPQPLETHVLASLMYRLPLYVETPRGTWRVDAGRVSFLGER